jgi:cytochrome c oxidase subunit 2
VSPPSRIDRRRLWALLGLAALVLAACSQDYPYNSLAPGGPVAQKQKDLFVLVFWIAVAVFILVEGALVFAAIRFRRRGPDDLPVQVHGNTRLEIVWTILPALLLAGIAVPTVGTIFELSRIPENAMEVTVTAHQWWWEVRYPTEDPEVVTANEIHIPMGRPVSFTLESEDVIHSFWVPTLGGKQDLVPGDTRNLVLQADRPGTYFGQCAEYCGRSHANMKFVVVAESQADFDAWVEAEQEPPARPEEDTEAGEGAALFKQFTTGKGSGSCLACHSVDPTGQEGAQIGPNLTHFGSRTVLAGGILENTPENVARWLADPGAVKPGARMPDYALSEEQIEDLVVYLESLE